MIMIGVNIIKRLKNKYSAMNATITMLRLSFSSNMQFALPAKMPTTTKYQNCLKIKFPPQTFCLVEIFERIRFLILFCKTFR